MQSKQYLQYFICLTLNGLPEAHLPPYEVGQETYERLGQYMAAASGGQVIPSDPAYPHFLWFRTTAGVNVLISEKDIDMLRLFTQPASPPPPPPARPAAGEEDEAADDFCEGSETIGQVEIYLRGRSKPIVTSTLENPVALGEYFLLLDDPAMVEMFIEEEGELIYFIDDDGEEAAIRIDRLTLLAAHPGSLRLEFDGEEDEDDAGWF